MPEKNKEEWLDWYKQRTGCENLELAPDELVFFHPEHGFISYFTHDDIIEIHHLCGDGKFWQMFLKKVAGFESAKKIRAFTRRNPQAWIRKYGGHIRGYYMEVEIDELKDF